MEQVHPVRTSKGTTLVATAIAVFISVWTIHASAQDQYHTGFGKTLGHQGCGQASNMVSAFHGTANNMRSLKDIPESTMNDSVIRDYLHANLKLEELPKDSAEYKVFSRMSELIMDGEDLSTVKQRTRELCEREFGSPQ